MNTKNQKAIPRYQSAKRFAIANGLPFFFLSDIERAIRIQDNNQRLLEDATWIQNNIVRSSTPMQLIGCKSLIVLFRMKWLSFLKGNPATTINPWNIHDLLLKYIRERSVDLLLNKVLISPINDGSVHDEWNHINTDEGTE